MNARNLLRTAIFLLLVLIIWGVSKGIPKTALITTVSPLLSGILAAIAYGAFRRIIKLSRLSLSPGWGLRRFAELCFSKKTFAQVLEPALSDMQKEHFDALFAGRPWQARMALVRGYWAFWSAVFAQLPISLARRIYEVWKATKK